MAPRPLLVLLALALCLAPRASGQGRGGPPSDDIGDNIGDDLGNDLGGELVEETPAAERGAPQPALGRVPDAAGWAARVARDARVSVAVDTETRAVELLLGEDRDPWDEPATTEERAVAAYAVAWSDDDPRSSRRRLLALAADPEPLVRRAVVLGLAEAGPFVVAPLIERSGDPEIASAVLLALAVGGVPAGLAHVEERAADASYPFAAEARAALAFARAPLACEPFESGALWYDLRWEAARRFGLVDGQVWRTVIVDGLCADPGFLRSVVLRASRVLTGQAAADHAQEVLTEGEGVERFGLAVALIPRTLNDLVRFGLWAPADEVEWSALLDAVEHEGAEARVADLLEEATHVAPLTWRVRALLARAGRSVDLERRREGPDAPEEALELTPSELVWWARAVAESRASERLDELERLEDHERPPVRAAARVARARLGNEGARHALGKSLDELGDEDRPALIAELARHARDVWVRALLENLLVEEQGPLGTPVALGLAREGSLSARSRLRRALRRGELEDQVQIAALAALGHAAGPEDVELFQELWPLEGQRDANVEIVAGMIARADPASLPVLRTALWREGWPLGLLAGGLFAETLGTRTLRDELRRAPPSASSNDLRRVGFALGEWGGMTAVKDLAHKLRNNAADPALQGALLGALAARTY